MAKHKTLGQVFTPRWIIIHILDLAGYDNELILDKYILEPSCGDGAFLIEIVNRYINICQQNNIANEDILSRLEKYIYGVEIDDIEHKKSIDNLTKFVQQKLDISEYINWKVYNLNTINFFKNHLLYFDFIVGNPPYIRVHNLNHRTRRILKKEFSFSTGTIDIYLSFFEMGIQMLKTKGILGYITPNSYLHNSSYKSFREYLKSERVVKTLVDFKATKIFKGYSTYTAITIVQKGYQEKSFEYREFVNGNIESVNNIYFDSLGSGDWSFTNPANENFITQIQSGTNYAVKDFFEVQYGFATLRDRIFISKTSILNDELVFFNGVPVEKKILRKIVKASRFKGKVNINEQIIFPYELDNKRYNVIPEHKLANEYPFAYRYLLKNKDELQSRDIEKSATWYEFGRSQGVQNIHSEKIVLSTLVKDQIEFHKIPGDVLVYSGLYIIKSRKDVSWSVIENVLNSPDFNKYIQITGKDFSGGYKSITSKQIKEYKITLDNPDNSI